MCDGYPTITCLSLFEHVQMRRCAPYLHVYDTLNVWLWFELQDCWDGTEFTGMKFRFKRMETGHVKKHHVINLRWWILHVHVCPHTCTLHFTRCKVVRIGYSYQRIYLYLGVIVCSDNLLPRLRTLRSRTAARAESSGHVLGARYSVQGASFSLWSYLQGWESTKEG